MGLSGDCILYGLFRLLLDITKPTGYQTFSSLMNVSIPNPPVMYSVIIPTSHGHVTQILVQNALVIALL